MPKTKAAPSKKPAAKKPAKAKAKPAATKSRAPTAATKERAAEIETRLKAAMPEPRCELNHENAWQLLVATILSAQSTDRMVNKVTPSLFARFPTPAALAKADQDELETLVKSTGFFRNKAKAIRAASQQIAEQFGGDVPRTLDEIIQLPGVARKTANVVLGTAYRVASGMTVDTHAGRVSRRLQLTKHDDPVKVEQDLCAVFPQESWIDMGHRFVLHGRYICLARSPRCSRCPLNELCKAREAPPAATWQARAKLESDRVLAAFGST
ncbi:MAG TPA: endonuclease III [Polyangiales bacterium]|nr:endonuclease III [Polyangiales bacterium]